MSRSVSRLSHRSVIRSPWPTAPMEPLNGSGLFLLPGKRAMRPSPTAMLPGVSNRTRRHRRPRWCITPSDEKAAGRKGVTALSAWCRLESARYAPVLRFRPKRGIGRPRHGGRTRRNVASDRRPGHASDRRPGMAPPSPDSAQLRGRLKRTTGSDPGAAGSVVSHHHAPADGEFRRAAICDSLGTAIRRSNGGVEASARRIVNAGVEEQDGNGGRS